MEVEKHGVVNPEPFYKISFGCGNRAFYDVKNEIYKIAEANKIEDCHEHIHEDCDYEGDLVNMVILDDSFAKAILKHYKIDVDLGKMNLHLSIF